MVPFVREATVAEVEVPVVVQVSVPKEHAPLPFDLYRYWYPVAVLTTPQLRLTCAFPGVAVREGAVSGTFVVACSTMLDHGDA